MSTTPATSPTSPTGASVAAAGPVSQAALLALLLALLKRLGIVPRDPDEWATIDSTVRWVSVHRPDIVAPSGLSGLSRQPGFQPVSSIPQDYTAPSGQS